MLPSLYMLGQRKAALQGFDGSCTAQPSGMEPTCGLARHWPTVAHRHAGCRGCSRLCLCSQLYVLLLRCSDALPIVQPPLQQLDQVPVRLQRHQLRSAHRSAGRTVSLKLFYTLILKALQIQGFPRQQAARKARAVQRPGVDG